LHPFINAEHKAEQTASTVSQAFGVTGPEFRPSLPALVAIQRPGLCNQWPHAAFDKKSCGCAHATCNTNIGCIASKVTLCLFGPDSMKQNCYFFWGLHIFRSKEMFERLGKLCV